MSERLIVTHEPPTHPDQIWAHSPLGYALFSPVVQDGHLVDALILYYNEPGASWLGRSPTELTGQLLSEALPGLEQASYDRLATLWLSRESYTKESLYADDRAMGTYNTTFWVADPHIVCIFHNTTSVSRKLAEALRENEGYKAALAITQQTLAVAQMLQRVAHERGVEVSASA